MIESVKKLRKIVPIPMAEALQLLKDNGGDVEKCVNLFKNKTIHYIMEQTDCDEEMANAYYEAEKMDINRAISFINDEMYDRHYTPIEGITVDTVRLSLQWLKLMEVENFAYSLDFISLPKVIETLALVPELKQVSDMLRRVKAVKDEIFEGYTDELPMEDFVRRHKRLDDDADFTEANTLLPLRREVINQILLRHLRNVPKE